MNKERKVTVIKHLETIWNQRRFVASNTGQCCYSIFIAYMCISKWQFSGIQTKNVDDSSCTTQALVQSDTTMKCPASNYDWWQVAIYIEDDCKVT